MVGVHGSSVRFQDLSRGGSKGVKRDCEEVEKEVGG